MFWAFDGRNDIFTYELMPYKINQNQPFMYITYMDPMGFGGGNIHEWNICEFLSQSSFPKEQPIEMKQISFHSNKSMIQFCVFEPSFFEKRKSCGCFQK